MAEQLEYQNAWYSDAIQNLNQLMIEHMLTIQKLDFSGFRCLLFSSKKF